LTYDVKIWHKTAAEINGLPPKTRRIIHDAIGRLGEDPYPGRGGDKEKLVLRGGVIIYRLHIARTWTAFYNIDEASKRVLVEEVLTIEQAHKKYDRI
jgi:mRNA-degrading endonuclease RelE of RelBE toxin-antitoxin system